MTRTLICILCPNSCRITAETDGGALTRCEGNGCPRGETYVRDELLHPMRNFATTVEVTGGLLPLCPVRLTGPIPLERLQEAAEAVHRCLPAAPVAAGQVILPNLLGLGVDVIATRSVPAAADREL